MKEKGFEVDQQTISVGKKRIRKLKDRLIVIIWVKERQIIKENKQSLGEVWAISGCTSIYTWIIQKREAQKKEREGLYEAVTTKIFKVWF